MSSSSQSAVQAAADAVELVASDAAATKAAQPQPSPLESTVANERPVARIGRALAVVPSVRPSQKAWRKLGFELSDSFEFMGCAAFDLVLAGCGVRFLAPIRNEINPLTAAIGDLLERGAGLLGWTWACQSVHRSRDVIEARSGLEFEAVTGGRKTVVTPRKVAPGATTLLEPLVHEEVPRHPNRVVGLDHIVLMVTDADATADIYERYFGLKARRAATKERRYAFLKVGEVGGSVIEIVGPLEPSRGPVMGHGWGLAFRTDDLNWTVRYLRESGVQCAEPREATQGGRISSLPMQIGGIQIAFLGN
jgi:catechol 2,3-dioxygenase-like lactoylglutathione lyase family enzyme